MIVLHPRNWSRYSRQFQHDKEQLSRHKRIILLSQFTLFGAVVGIIHAIEDLVDGLLFMPMMDSVMAVSIFACYLVNEKGYHRVARIILLTFLNLFFFVYASLAHPDLGIYFYFFSWVGLAAVVFEINENALRFFFIGLSIVLTIILFVTNFRVFGTEVYGAVDLGRSFIINLVSSISVLVFFIVFMVNTNESSERKLIELTDDIRKKNDELQKVNRELDRFFYSASHDLKVPLLDIKGAINSAMADIREPSVLGYFDTLKQRANRMDHFLQDIIDYSRNSHTHLRTEPINLHELVQQVLENFSFVSGADKVRFVTNIAVNKLIIGDRVRLMVVLNNLIGNAIKFHRLDQADPWIKIEFVGDEYQIIGKVDDNGSGINDDLQSKIFNMFFRGTNQSKGSGLGLYIVKETIEKMGGSVSVISSEGSGTSFTFNVPISIAVQERVEEGSSVTVL